VRGRLFPTEADWCEWHQDPALPGTVLVRVGVGDGGRLVLTGLRIDGAPTAELLRSVPVGRIEAAANAQLTIVEDRVVPAAIPHRPGREPRAAHDGWETSDPVRAVARPAARAGDVPDHRVPDHRVADHRVADGARGRPDRFYRDVARAYRDLAQSSARPAADLAEASGVPTTTAHRWIKEARRRGFLPPGRPGKAG